MTTLLSVSAGNITIRDTDGTVVFNTDERLFCATNSVSGSVTLSAYTASEPFSGTSVRPNVDSLHSLASINASADIVRGAFYVSTGDGSGSVTARGWFNAGGTYVHNFSAVGQGLSSSATNDNTVVSCFAAYTFLASGGVLYLHERVVMRAPDKADPGTNFVSFTAPTFFYNLLCGTFV